VSVHDVAAYILAKHGGRSAMHLHRLVYYVQAWSTVWGHAPIFRAKIGAWSSGPVCPELWRNHRGMLSEIHRWPWGDVGKLTDAQCSMIDAVLGHYGAFTALQLVQLTQLEPPWKDARRGLAPGAHGSATITQEAMRDYYGSIGSP